jgi:hypothetical protein
MHEVYYFFVHILYFFFVCVGIVIVTVIEVVEEKAGVEASVAAVLAVDGGLVEEGVEWEEETASRGSNQVKG